MARDGMAPALPRPAIHVHRSDGFDAKKKMAKKIMGMKD